MVRKRIVGASLTALAVAVSLAACGRSKESASTPTTVEETASTVEALTAAPNLQLKVRTDVCTSRLVVDTLEVANVGTTPVKLSDITIKLWADDTTGNTLVPVVVNGGCLARIDATDDDDCSDADCFHHVQRASAAASTFSPACGTDPTRRANWEVTVSTADTSILAPGKRWSNINASLVLSNFGAFNPGTADWYSSCLPDSHGKYGFDSHYAVYVAGQLVTSSPGVPPSCRASHGSQPLSGNVPPNLGSFPLVGPLPVGAPVSLAIGLPLQRPADLAAMVAQVSDPTSPQYRQYLTPDAFAAGFGPTQADYDAVRSFATANGLTVTGTYATRDVLTVSGPAAAVENAFFVTLNVYRRPDGGTFYAPANEPSLNLPQPLLLHVSGFDSFAVPFPASHTSPHLCFGLSNAFFGTDYRNTYVNPCATMGPVQNMGAGQTIALFEPDTYVASDIFNYADGAAGALGSQMQVNGGTLLENALSNSVAQVVVPSGAYHGFFDTGIGFSPGNGKTEVEVGMEMALSMAPESRVVVYEQNGGATFLPVAILQQLAERMPAPLPQVPPAIIANSWTWNAATPDPTIAQVFLQYAVQGQSFFQAAGDLGSYNVAGSVLPNVPNPIIDSSLMTVVGGTQFTPANAETTWNDISNQSQPPGTCVFGPGQTAGTALQQAGSCNSVTGGGFCSAYGAYSALGVPTYQKGITNTDIPAGNLTRMVPDVSIVADNLATYTNGAVSCSVGTSAAAALWAGVAALANHANTNYTGPVGFLNPELYFLRNSGALHDINDGSGNHYKSAAASAATPYTATNGYDLATGLGSPTCALLPSLPPQSCLPGNAISAVVSGSNVTAYLPNGSYGEQKTGIRVVSIEGSGPQGAIATPGVVNTCGGISGTGGHPATGDVVCTANDLDVYLITGTTINSTLASASDATHTEDTSGGSCNTCNVATDSIHNQAFLSIATTSGAALQRLDLSTGLLDPSVIPLNQESSSEDILIDPIRGFVLSPNEGPENDAPPTSPVGNYQLINTTTGAVYNNYPGGTVGRFDSAAEDCTTGIALSTLEFSNQLFLVDLTQATFSGNTWTAPSNFVTVNEFSGFSAGTSGISMAPGTHLGVVTGEFGGNQFGVIQLPATSGTGAPSLVNWVQATIPNTPDSPTNLPWSEGDDPHDLATYVSPTTGRAYAILDDDVNQDGTRTWIAVVDLQRVIDAAAGGHTVSSLVTCQGAGQNGTPAVPNCAVRFIQSP